MTIKIQVHGFGIGFGPDKGAQHANDLGPFFIDGRGVEVVDLLKTLWAHWVGKGPLVLSELTATQVNHIPNPFDWGRAHIAGELAVAVYCQPFFQAQLEPITASDAIARPVVEIFMGNDRLYPLKVRIGRRIGGGKYTRGVEYIQPLVLHSAHIEVIHCNDVKDVEVIFTAIDLFIPFHGILKGLHTKGAFSFITWAHIKV